MSKMFFLTDVEATGPDFATHSMYEFAMVPVLTNGTVLPGMKFEVDLLSYHETDHYADTLKFLEKDLGITIDSLRARKNILHPNAAMEMCNEFVSHHLSENRADKPLFVADNLAFDWGYMHTYFFRYLKQNPFGYAGRNIPDLSLGYYGSRSFWERFRTQQHTHDALDDTAGNAGAFAHMIKDGLKV